MRIVIVREVQDDIVVKAEVQRCIVALMDSFGAEGLDATVSAPLGISVLPFSFLFLCARLTIS